MEFRAGGDALVLHRGKDPRFHGGVDRRDHHGVFHRVHDRPFAGALLTGGIEDHVNQRGTGFGIDLFENLGGDLDEITFEVAVVPIGENLAQFRSRESGGLENVVGLADQLHVAELDAIVDHFHIMPRATGTDVGDARFSIDLRGDRFENRLHHIPGGKRSAGHDCRSLASAFLTAGNAGSDETQAFFRKVRIATLGIGVERIAAVDDDIALVEQGDQLFDHRINRCSGLDHDLDFPRGGERLHEFLERFRTDEFFAGMRGDEFIGGGGGAIEHADLETARFHIENKILAHDGQSDKSKVAFAHDRVMGWSAVRKGKHRFMQPLVGEMTKNMVDSFCAT